MTSLYQDIRNALQTRLETVTGLPETVYEGVSYAPVPGTPFIASALVPAAARPVTMGQDHLILHEGTFEIAVSYPSGVGTGSAEAMADAIKAVFTAESVLTVGANNIRIRYSERRQALIDSDWIRIPVSVGWYLHSQTY